MGKVFIGTSGYTYPSWRGTFYPQDLAQRKWLSFYASQFETVEVNATFYRSFSKDTFQKWAQMTPKNFFFVIKGPRMITHLKRLNNLSTEVSEFLYQTDGLGGKLRIILWQFPASFSYNDKTNETMRRFLTMLPKTIQQAFEFRHLSWFTEEALDMFTASKTSLVINETLAFPTISRTIGDFTYIRFHGPTSLYASSYTDQQLSQWAKTTHGLKQYSDVYCYFNNDVSGFAIQNAIKLRELVIE
jgi:uncharacterized protein YecE (DUF72 family)